MNKIILLGHTSPIGSVLHAHLSKSYEIIGISRDTGYDLLKKEYINLVVEQSTTAQHFINLINISTQADILYSVYNMWSHRGKNGKIINFGTLATEIPFNLLKKMAIDMEMVSNKLLLEKMHRELSFKQPFGNQPQSVLIRFANYGKKKDNRQDEPFTTPEQMINIIDFIINTETYISALDFREI